MTAANRAGRPRVVMVVRLFHPWVGGTERQALKLSKALIDAGASVTVVTGRWFRATSRSEVIEGVPVVRHHTLWEFFGIRGLRKLGGYLYMVTLAWRLVRTRHDYDIVHVHGFNYHTAVASAVGRRLGKPVIVKLANSGHASDILRMREGRQLAGAGLLTGAALRCDRFVAVSSAIANELEEAGVDADTIVSIPNGVEVGDPPPATAPISGGSLRVLYVGRLHRQKGVDVLVDALALLQERKPGSIAATIVGDGPERRVLEAQVADRHLGAVVQFVGEVAEPGLWMDDADLVVLPSRTEGMSNVLLEAMARAKAVIATAVSGTTDVVEDGITAMMVAPEDPAGLADAIDRLLTGPDEIRRLGTAAAEAVRRQYSLSHVAGRYLDLYADFARPPTRHLMAGRREDRT